jgi:drug/metabolite transporter (DMT)-like permease
MTPSRRQEAMRNSTNQPGAGPVGPRHQDLRVAVAYMALAALSFAVMGAFVKASTARLPFLFALLFRNFMGLIPLGIWYLATGRRPGAVRPRLLFLRALLGFTAMFLFFFSIGAMPLSTATVLNYSSPVFVVLLSALAFRDRRTLRLLPLVAIAFLGVALMVRFDMSVSWVSATIGLLSAVFAALAYMTVRELSATESSVTIVWYFTVWGVVLSSLALVVAWLLDMGNVPWDCIAAKLSDPLELALLCCVGLFGTLAQLAMTAAYARAQASVIAPISYLNPLISYGLGLALFQDPLTATALGGGALVVVSSLAILRLSSRPAAGGEAGKPAA